MSIVKTGRRERGRGAWTKADAARAQEGSGLNRAEMTPGHTTPEQCRKATLTVVASVACHPRIDEPYKAAREALEALGLIEPREGDDRA
jgi:hypothetical protein